MESSKRKWISITLLSIAIPFGLLAAFRLTGILQEPLVPEVVHAEAVNWNMSRPAGNDVTERIIISDEVTKVYNTDFAFFELDVAIYYYAENDPVLPFGGNDGLGMRLTATANVSSGFVHSFAIRFSKNDSNALIDINEDSDVRFLHNLELQRIVDLQPESYIEVLGINQPHYCELEISSHWVFIDENNVDHQMIVALEVTYFNGTTYRKAVLPIQLEMLIH